MRTYQRLHGGPGRLILSVVLVAGAFCAKAEERRWAFRVFLDDKPIGTHVFTLQDRDGFQELKSQAAFSIKFLMVTAYRYEHTAIEHWRDGCLVSMEARTNDDGKKFSVSAHRDATVLIVNANGTRTRLPECILSFAYWSPAILGADRLLNAQTGRLEQVIIENQGRDEFATARGSRMPANRYRIVGPDQPITLWYDEAKQWIGLESRVGKGRRLTYRLE